jgi:GAF domain-containing protein
VAETGNQDEIGRLTRAFNSMTARLRQTLNNLEKGTADLARRSTQLETAAQVARDAAAIHDVEGLLEQTAGLISDRFGFYHTGVFLLDEEGQFAILRAASSDGGHRMLERGHQLAVGKVGLVGRAAASGETRIALDVGADAAFFDNPDLPDTRSEMALPLVVRGKTIGVLDVQSTQEAAFTRDDVAILQTMADQVALAIDNARLLAEAQAALEATRRAYGELSQQAWTELLSSRKEWGYRYTRKAVTPTKGDWHTEMLQAIQSGQSVHETGTGEPTLAVPLKVRDQVVGALRFSKGAEGGDWLPDEISQLQTLAEQVSVALDSARLYQDIQRRAARERLTAQVTARMRQTLDLDAVLQTAVREISSALGLVALDVHLGTEAETIQDSVPSLSKQ